MVSAILAFGFATLWWRLWMYYSWIGAPGVLSWLLGADGEGAYDALWIEMFIISLAVVGVLLFVLYATTRKRSARVATPTI